MPPRKRVRRTQATDRDSRPRRSGDAARRVPSSRVRAPVAITTATARRQAQRQARLQSTRRRRPPLLVVVLVLGTLAVLIVAISITLVIVMKPTPGLVTTDDGREHIPDNVPIGQTTFKPYSTDPPTSGAHWITPAPKGIYQEAADERLVHSLEHGYVVINHNCNETECPDLYEGLKDIYFRYDEKVILNYRPSTDSRIALASWTRLDKMDELEEIRITQFIEAYRGKIGPEKNSP